MPYAQIGCYHLINSYSKTNAGGVACYCYLKKSILFSNVSELPFDSSDCESLFLQINGRSGKNLHTGVVYRHPKASIQEFPNNLFQTLNFLEHYKYEYIFCGDFNLDFLKYGSIINAIRNYIDTLHSYGCINFIDKATRITPKTATLIDHIYSNIIAKSVGSGTLTFGISDHLRVFCTVKFTNKFDNSCLHRNVKTFNAEEFADELNLAVVNLASNNLTACSRYFTSPPIDECFTFFLNKFSKILNEHAPLQKKYKKSEKQIMKLWITKDILKSIKTKN